MNQRYAALHPHVTPKVQTQYAACSPAAFAAPDSSVLTDTL